MQTLSLHENDDIVTQRYRIVTLLGQGSMGTTYEAEDLTNYQRVALKVVSLQHMEEWKVLELFEREARVLAHLEHPGIPKFIDCFWEDTPEDRRFYLIRELASGDSLAAWVEKGWHPQESQVREVARQVLEILDYLHSLTPPVVHRDIKPENIIRHADGRVFLVDFGAVQDVYRNTLTRGGTFVGTLGYMPPEQFFGQVGAASDLYSLGAMLLFLLTGESPADLPQRRMKLKFRDRIDVSTEFADWLEKMLEPAVEERLKSVKDAADTLLGQVNLTDLTEPYERFGRVILQKNDRHFLCEILPDWIVVLISLAMLAIPLCLVIAFLPTSFPLFPLLLLLVGFGLVNSGGRQYLKIDGNFLTISVRFVGITVYRRQREREDISLVGVEIISSGVGNKVTSTSLKICTGFTQHTFGSNLKRAEQEWLACQISNFLNLENSKWSSFTN
ncbi:serine/threonine protein kinase [Oscillatoriales cyanobacterium LEGE 11467]|uniref:non-specific serine/threonine protein kinase n=1 Tax=Zarconia navalis LEGE 11467 TaxID=1828826 RepID=A0A928Z709_9CYAN|nr:serine/threonine-protein kinase [Zarconia navalis]MBE9040957.1 serine/threonine protein kinase [Zarconia navalis LEGE 11467]